MDRLKIVLITLAMAASFGSIPAEAKESASELCRFLNGELTQSQGYYARGQFLLAAMKASSLLKSSCNESDRVASKQIYSLSLFRLGEKDEALLALEGVEKEETGESRRRLLFVRSYLLGVPTDLLTSFDRGRLSLWNAREDETAFRSEFARFEGEPTYRASLAEMHREYRETRVKSPLVAGLASALIPGAGQAYNGAWQSAGLSFVLNSIFLWATIEFIDRKQAGAAIASGTIFSVTYLGNILSAAEGAQSVNRQARKPREEKLKKFLLPEITIPVAHF